MKPAPDRVSMAERQRRRKAYWDRLSRRRQQFLAAMPAEVSAEIVAAERRMVEALAILRQRKDYESPWHKRGLSVND